MIWRRGVVLSTAFPWSGVQELEVELTAAIDDSGTTRVRALSYLEQTGQGQVGDAVIVTAAALRRGLGTGGYAFVAAFPDRLPPDPAPAPGHIIKARYTPSQTLLLGVDEQESPHHETLANADDLGGLPVIGADVHSAVPAIIAGIRLERPDARIVYVMTDGGALPLSFSRTIAQLREANWLASTITVGQAYGGEYEAVNIYTGLLAAARVAKADLVIVAQGPGNLGTGTRWGFSGTSTGETLTAAGILGGQPIGSLRVSASDQRQRHYGISHHSLTVYQHLTHVRATIVAPEFSGDFGSRVRAQVDSLASIHNLVWEPLTGIFAALADSPVELRSMGRSLLDDPTPFEAVAAAGRWAARLSRPGPVD